MKPKYAKIQEVPGMIRDMETKAVISTDIDSLKSYKLRRSENEQMRQAISDINTLKDELTEIKALILEVIKKDAP